MPDDLAGRERANRLFDIYGALLTLQQQRLLRRYYRDDFSLGEIAEELRITRQAVHDGLRRALSAMERFEGALRLVATDPQRGRPGPRPGSPVPERDAAARGRRSADRRGGRDRPGEPTAARTHYFARQPRSPARARRVAVRLRGRDWVFQTASGVFAAQALDAGTRLLIETMELPRDAQVLDLGCGYGAAGLVAATTALAGRAWLVDVNARAVALAQANARANRVRNARVFAGDAASAVRDASMDVVVTNPPIRAGRAVVRTFIDDAWRVLRPGGRFYLVARTALGARTLGRLIEQRFGAARVAAVRGGYRVFEATRVADGTGAQAGGGREGASPPDSGRDRADDDHHAG